MQKNSNWHALDESEVLKLVDSSHEGLSSVEVEARLKKYGPNKLQEEKRKSALVRFLMQFNNLLIYVLLTAAVVTALLDHMVDTIVILGVVIVNAIIGFIQEDKAQNAMNAIKKLLAFHSVVMRDKSKQKVDSESLVIGDIVFMKPGDRVLADIRLLEAHGFSVQEAPLTGESIAVEKSVKKVSLDATIGDRSSMVFAGTTIASGQARGVIIATASNTELGRISGMISSVEVLTTPLVEQMDKFAKYLTVSILSFSLIIFLIGHYVKGLDFNEAFMAVVGLFVAAIPEGLPAVLTITLAVGVQAMAKRNAIVRQLPAIETIGSVSVICSDKTGTLTQNEMMVSSIVSYNADFTVNGSGYEPIGDVYNNGQRVEASKDEILMFLAKTSVLCSDATLKKDDDSWNTEGSPTEGALITFAHKTGFDANEARRAFKRDDMIPFDSKHKFMATLNHSHEGESLIVVKGAAEIIIKMSQFEYMDKNNKKKIEHSYWEEKSKELASSGQRVLALAYKKVPHDKSTLDFDDLEEGLVLISLVGLIDPPRPEAIEAIEECYRANIDVKMITGDHLLTAAAIGKTIGLKNCENILSGSDIEKLSEEELEGVVMQTDIFARTTPEHKLRLVKAFQAHSKVVAMTGDGVNDAPALKRANVGIAMGKSGTEAAKESSEFVLTDDNFASIVSAIREGRRVYDNIKKVISWTLPTNAAEASVIIVAVLFGMAMPITPIQILWANMITAVTLGIALAFEDGDKNIMERSPRAIDEPILSRDLIWHITYVTFLFLVAVFGAFYYAIESGATVDYARTFALNVLVFLEIFHLLYIRNLNIIDLKLKDILANKVVWSAISIIFFAQIAITYVPFLQSVFLTNSLTLSDFSMIFVIGSVVFVLLEIEKQFRLRVGMKI